MEGKEEALSAGEKAKALESSYFKFAWSPKTASVLLLLF